MQALPQQQDIEDIHQTEGVLHQIVRLHPGVAEEVGKIHAHRQKRGKNERKEKIGRGEPFPEEKACCCRQRENGEQEMPRARDRQRNEDRLPHGAACPCVIGRSDGFRQEGGRHPAETQKTVVPAVERDARCAAHGADENIVRGPADKKDADGFEPVEKYRFRALALQKPQNAGDHDKRDRDRDHRLIERERADNGDNGERPAPERAAEKEICRAHGEQHGEHIAVQIVDVRCRQRRI